MSDTPHPSGNDRYAIYAVGGTVGRKRLAETSRDGLGVTLITMFDEHEFLDDRGLPVRCGILDRETRLWIVNPWVKE